MLQSMKLFALFIISFFVYTCSYGQEVFTIKHNYDKKFFYISLSDIIPTIENEAEEKAFSMIPDNYRYNVQADQERYVLLPQKNKKNLLKYTKLSEQDNLYLYDFVNNKLITYKIKDLKGIASLNPYEFFEFAIHTDEETGENTYKEWTYFDYELGFQIPQTETYITEENYFENFFVAVGKTSPFELGKVQPILWKEVDNKTFPLSKTSQYNKDYIQNNNKTNIVKTYLYTLNDYNYFLYHFNIPQNRESQYDRGYYLIAVVKDNQLVSEELITTGGNSGYLPLNLQPRTQFDVCNHPIHQWAGELFKNSPPVYFGFAYAGDGCEWISKVELSDDYSNRISINCDNRH